MSTYSEKLKDPRWQRKRLEILNRENFTCESCGAEDKPLHVHHAYYKKNLQPWEYPRDSLHCLCADCHKEAQAVLVDLHCEIGRLSLWEIEGLLVFAREYRNPPPDQTPQWLRDLEQPAMDVKRMVNDMCLRF